MIDSLNIGQVIYNILSSNEELAKIVGNKIYPIIANIKNDSSETDLKNLMPFIIYKREGFSSNGCKDGTYQDGIDFSIKIVTKTYNQGITIANLVRAIFENKTLTYNNVTISGTYITNAYEDYNDNYSAFIQTIRFNTKIS